VDLPGTDPARDASSLHPDISPYYAESPDYSLIVSNPNSEASTPELAVFSFDSQVEDSKVYQRRNKHNGAKRKQDSDDFTICVDNDAQQETGMDLDGGHGQDGVLKHLQVRRAGENARDIQQGCKRIKMMITESNISISGKSLDVKNVVGSWTAEDTQLNVDVTG